MSTNQQNIEPINTENVKEYAPQQEKSEKRHENPER